MPQRDVDGVAPRLVTLASSQGASMSTASLRSVGLHQLAELRKQMREKGLEAPTMPAFHAGGNGARIKEAEPSTAGIAGLW
jgi:hypothetical protein